METSMAAPRHVKAGRLAAAARRELRRSARRIAWLVFAAALATALLGGLRWVEAARINRLVADGGAALAKLDAPHAKLARGLALARSGAVAEAAAAFRHAARGREASISVAAWYNSGNLYLREARRLDDAADTTAAEHGRAFAELAKDGYRRALRLQPDYWPARYNLERALAWYPDPDEESAGPAPRQSERAVTTMRGTSLGYP